MMLTAVTSFIGKTLTELIATGQALFSGNVVGMTQLPRPLAGLDLVGGNLGLDFANSLNSRSELTTDYVASYDGLLAWAERADILQPATRQSLLKQAATERRGSEVALRKAHALRDAIFMTFSAIAARQPPSPRDVQRVLRAYGRAVTRGSFNGVTESANLTWNVGATLSGVLDPIAFAAGELLLAVDRPTVKECPGCGWLFLDLSRNRSRRWCDMRTCGSRDKMRRYYRSRRRPPTGRARSS